MNAASADAARMRVQKQRETAGRRESAQVARARAQDKDSYEPGAAAYAAKARPKQSPDLQRYAERTNSRNVSSESRRART